MASISLCMIVKNEEKVLSRCLESIKDAVDEIIIVDTGSEDNTKNIAKEYTDSVYDFEWIDDFSAARNYSFSKAKKDFIMWLDADDVVTYDSKLKLIELKSSLDHADVVMLRYNTAYDEDSNPVFSYYRERIVRNKADYRWKGRVHEAIECKGRVIYGDAEIDHKSIKSEYSTRNLDIYEKYISESGEMTPRDMFYYGRELYYHKMYERAKKILTDFLMDNNGWIENKIEACKILSFCYYETGDIDNAFQCLFKSFAFDIPRAEICCHIGNLFIEKQEYERAVYWFESALNLPDHIKNGAFENADAHRYLPCIQLCVCYDKLKNYKEAQKYNDIAGRYRPASKAYLHNLDYFKYLHANDVL